MGTLYFISVTVFILYMVVSALTFGITASISETYYKWEEMGKDLGILFTSFIWSITFPLMIVWIEILPEDLNFIPFIASASLIFVGTATAFKLDLTKEVHIVSAIIAFITSYTWAFAYGNYFIALSTLIIFITAGLTVGKKHKLYWVELGAFINIYLQIGILL